MPIIKSAIKRVRQTDKKNARNTQTKRNLKVASKELMAAIDKKDSKKAGVALKNVQSCLDTAVKKNVMHKNKAARLKSNYNAKVKALGGKLEAKTTTKKPVAKKTITAKPATKKASAKKPAAKSKAAKK